jgi:meso-butanediol dehydrogenase/(S,S)-butanediol dehydrogenase/diacetyl reductase
VANAGVLHDAPLAETTDEAWDAVLETNLVGYYRYAVACLPHLRAAGGGSITMISSDAGVWGETPIAAYSVSKRAVNMLVQTLAVEAGPHGIRVNAVCPGDTAPGMATFVGGRDESGDPAGWTLPPLSRIGTGADVAAAVAFFASPDGSFCNGSILLVDGGMRASLRASGVAQR